MVRLTFKLGSNIKRKRRDLFIYIYIYINQKDNASILEEVLVHTHTHTHTHTLVRFCCEVASFLQHKHTGVIWVVCVSWGSLRRWHESCLACLFFILLVGSDVKTFAVLSQTATVSFASVWCFDEVRNRSWDKLYYISIVFEYVDGRRAKSYLITDVRAVWCKQEQLGYHLWHLFFFFYGLGCF